MIFSGFGKILGKIFEYGAVHDVLKGAGETGKERLKVVFDDAFRTDFGRVFLRFAAHSRSAAERLAGRLDYAGRIGKPVPENDMVKAIARLLPRDSEGRLNEDGTVELLNEVAMMPDPLFAALMAAMQHDVIAQKVHLFIQKHGTKALAAFNFADAAAERLATALEPTANRLRQEAEPKGRWRSWTDC